jgi:hypothetical protein
VPSSAVKMRDFHVYEGAEGDSVVCRVSILSLPYCNQVAAP